ncbi:MAG: Eco57I restriction-modification methylase domain-containing protein [Bacteroidetes bacterium]|nr:Eco57I restriction-modification methylase domain-containing protein [Bacteroidota bacterium]
MIEINYNPDVLSCLANLSNDEVFTPPKLVNEILDMLPQELFQSKETTFLDPVTKSGVFLREIAKRLNDGLKDQIPDQQERIDHIFSKQVYGIAITELTSLLARRSVYCTKKANGKYSVCTSFETEEGNIKYDRLQHTWQNGKCTYCGASEEVYSRTDDLETYAYQFIHTDKPQNIFNMKFDVIIGNPPYQLGDGGNNASATPIYNLFVEQAKKLNPRFLSMIIPARWYAGGRGLNDFRNEMLSDNHLKVIHDFKNTADCFPGIRVGGGICYFLRDLQYNSEEVQVHTHKGDKVIKTAIRPKLQDGLDIFIRDSIAAEIIKKVALINPKRMSSIALSQKPFGMRTNFTDFKNKGSIKLYTKKSKSGFAFIEKEHVTKNSDFIGKWKVVTSRSTSVPEEDNGQVLRISQTFIAEPNSVVTESYVVVGVFDSEEEAKSCLTYLKTKFFRLLCQITIVSPDVSQRTFDLVPLEDFSSKLSDNQLYEKYKLTSEEIELIESTIKELQ